MAGKHLNFDIAMGPKLSRWPLPGKALATMIVVMMGLGLAVALGQILVHDIIPTFWSDKIEHKAQTHSMPEKPSDRGDLFSHAPMKPEHKPLYQTDEFIFALKFTHIHIFGMSGIFIVMGMVVLFLDASVRTRTWLIILPFIGILIDLGSVWLKIFIHPLFFWLHAPGGMLFGVIFCIDAVFIIRQLWFEPQPANRQDDG